MANRFSSLEGRYWFMASFSLKCVSYAWGLRRYWVPEPCLVDRNTNTLNEANQDPNPKMIHDLVGSFVNKKGRWYYACLEVYLCPKVVDASCANLFPFEVDESDGYAWEGSHSGMFSVNSAYAFLVPPNVQNEYWQPVQHRKVLHRIPIFRWTTYLNRLMTSI